MICSLLLAAYIKHKTNWVNSAHFFQRTFKISWRDQSRTWFTTGLFPCFSVFVRTNRFCMIQSNESKRRIVREHARFAILFICLVAQTILKLQLNIRYKINCVICFKSFCQSSNHTHCYNTTSLTWVTIAMIKSALWSNLQNIWTN